MKDYCVDLKANNKPYFLKIQEILDKANFTHYSPPLPVTTSFAKRKNYGIRFMLDGAKILYHRNDAYNSEFFNFSAIAKVEGFSPLLEGELYLPINSKIELTLPSFSFYLGGMNAYTSLTHRPEDTQILESLTNYRPLAEAIRHLIEAGEILPQYEKEGEF